MKSFTNGVAKLFVSNLALIPVIAILPVFLITSDIQAYDKFIDYLFKNKELGV